MKCTPQEAISLLQEVGLTVELVEEGSEYDKNSAIQAIDAKRSEFLAPQIIQEFKDSEINKIKAAQGGSLRSKLVRKTGISRSELDKIQNDEEAIEAAFAFKAASLEGDKEETNKRIDEILNTHKLEVEGIKKEYQSQLAQAEEKYISKEMKEYFTSILKDAPLPQDSDRSLLAELVMNHIKGKVDLKLDAESKQPIAYKKGTEERLLNESRTAVYDFMPDVKSFLEPMGLWQKDTRGLNPSDLMKGTTPVPEAAPSFPTDDIAKKKAEFDRKLTEMVSN